MKQISKNHIKNLWKAMNNGWNIIGLDDETRREIKQYSRKKKLKRILKTKV
jgi:hypothetical protein